MNKNLKAELKNVERTLLLPLWGRYSESRKETGLIKDSKCVELVEKWKIDLSGFEKSQNPASRLAWVARVWNVDLELKNLASSGEPLTVVCLGCGLDTGFFRLTGGTPDPEAVSWYDLDLPRVIDIRRKLLGENPGCRMIAGSALDAESFRGIKVRGKAVVIAVGLLYYFTEKEVRRIFQNIAGLAGTVTVIFDYCSALGITVANKQVLHDCPGERMIWSAEGEPDLLRLHPSARVVETYPVFRKILPALKTDDAKIAAQADAVKIMSFAVMETAG